MGHNVLSLLHLHRCTMYLALFLATLTCASAHSINRVILFEEHRGERTRGDTPAFPLWPDMFQQNFTEILTYPVVGSHKTNGTYYYDYANRRYRIDRDNGRYDRYCGINGAKEFVDTPCTQLVLKGMRWLIYPEKKECCQCCTSEQGCGVLFPGWMTNATFLGKVSWHGQTVYKWDKQGLQHNYYYETTEDDPKSRVLLEIDQQPNDDQIYNPDTRKLVIEDPEEVFALPSYCEAKSCSFFSTCHAVG